MQWEQTVELTLSQSAGLSDLSVVEQADAAGQRPECHHTSVVFNLTAGTSLQNYKQSAQETQLHLRIEKALQM